MNPPPRSGPWNQVAQELYRKETPTCNNPHYEYYKKQQDDYRNR